MIKDINCRYIALICACNLLLMIIYIWITAVYCNWIPEGDTNFSITEIFVFDIRVILVNITIIILNLLTKQMGNIWIAITLISLMFIVIVIFLDNPKIYMFVLFFVVAWIIWRTYTVLKISLKE